MKEGGLPLTPGRQRQQDARSAQLASPPARPEPPLPAAACRQASPRSPGSAPGYRASLAAPLPRLTGLPAPLPTASPPRGGAPLPPGAASLRGAAGPLRRPRRQLLLLHPSPPGCGRRQRQRRRFPAPAQPLLLLLPLLPPPGPAAAASISSSRGQASAAPTALPPGRRRRRRPPRRRLGSEETRRLEAAGKEGWMEGGLHSPLSPASPRQERGASAGGPGTTPGQEGGTAAAVTGPSPRRPAPPQAPAVPRWLAGLPGRPVLLDAARSQRSAGLAYLHVYACFVGCLFVCFVGFLLCFVLTAKISLIVL
ncbi:atherin-like [Columba livia]|uniref:atherin-like n=1 Tax=Columba livia TaxID=8932 RepID=UPI0031BABB77